MNHVFSLPDTEEIQNLLRGTGFHDVSVPSDKKTLRLPAPEEFLWQYVLAGAITQVDDERRASLSRAVVKNWQEFVKDGALVLDLRIVIATAWN